jgi:hypothetical protein
MTRVTDGNSTYFEDPSPSTLETDKYSLRVKIVLQAGVSPNTHKTLGSIPSTDKKKKKKKLLHNKKQGL